MNDTLNLAGGLLGSNPELYDGITHCVVRTIPKMSISATYCGAVAGAARTLVPMSGPQHCVDNIITLTPPTCYCGVSAICLNTNTAGAQWQCQVAPTVTETYSYDVQIDCTYPLNYPGCTCFLYVTNHYDCLGNFTYQTSTLLGQECMSV
jgi:hypothetical protein